MKVDTARVLAQQKLERLARDSAEAGAFWREATDVLRHVLPFDFYPCWFTLDPTTLLVTGHLNEGLAHTPGEIAQSWYAEGDVNSPGELASIRGGAATVKAATGGDPAASWRWRHLLTPFGFDDSLDAVLRAGRTAWGAMSLLHSADTRPFTRGDIRYVASLSAALADGTRLGLLRSEAGPVPGGDSPAVLVMSHDATTVTATPNAERWFEMLPDIGPFAPDRVPIPIQVVVLRAVLSAEGEVAVTLRATDGGWIRIHGSRLSGPVPPQVAVVVDTATPHHLAPLRLSAHGLTRRESDVVEQVLRGRSTAQIAENLFISEYTVQDRLKAVFEKVGVRSRRQLVAVIHAAEYQPLIDTNDDNNQQGLPIRRKA